MEITYEEKHSLESQVHWGGSSCKRHGSGQMVHFLALEIQHIVNSLTGVVQMHPLIGF